VTEQWEQGRMFHSLVWSLSCTMKYTSLPQKWLTWSE